MGGKVPEEELKNYRKQYDCFQRICQILETSDDCSQVMDLMQEMQNYGNPPSEIVGDLLPDLLPNPDSPNSNGTDSSNPLAALFNALPPESQTQGSGQAQAP